MSLAEDHFSEQTTLSFLINYLIMKSFLKKMVAAVSLVVAMVANVEAQNSFAYQAVIRTAKGELVSNKEIGMQFSLIYDGKVVYCETQKPTTNQYGSVQVEVGKGQKVSGSFADVPWSTMQVMMKIEADPNGGTNYIDLGTIQLQPAPYAMYAPAAGKVTTIQAGDPKSDSNALFEVKDKDGNVVFAVYPDGVRVFVDDSDSTVTKAISTGFAVSGRKAAKEGEEANIFAVNAQGTQVFVNEEDTAGGKAMQTGFAVSGRKAAKDGSDLFTVGSTGTQVYIDEDATKAVRTGFAVSGRRGGAKDTDKYLEINTDGTHVYIDNEDDSTKAVRTGFAVSGRRGGAKDAAKYMEINADGTKVYVGADGKAIKTGFAVSGRRGGSKGKEIKLFEVNNFGTQIYIDAENTKAQRTGFAVSGRRGAAKDGNFDSNQDKYMVIDADGTVIYVDYEAAKAIQTGFAVSGRKAAKDGTQNTILKVDNAEGTHIYIEDVDGKVMPTGFAVSGRKAAKDGESDLMRITGDKTTITAKNLGMLDKESDKSMMSITSDSTKIITDDLQLLNHNDSTLLTTNNGNVEVMNDLVVLGDVAQTVDADTVEDALPIYMAVVERIDTIVCADTAPGLQAAKGYALLKIYGNGLFAQNQNIDAEGNNVILFDANGNPIQQHQAAAAAVILAKASTADAKLIVWPLKQVNNLKICFGLMAAGDTANRYVNVEAYVNASAPVECLVDVKAEVDSLGTVVVNGPKVYGEKVDLVPQPIEGYHFTKWTDGRQANPRTALILHDTAFASANFEINTYNIIAKAKNGKVEISGPWNADTTFNHGSKITLKAIPFENHHFMGWSDGDTAKLRQFTIKSDTTFEALFAIDSFNIKLQAKNGMVAGEGVYPYGTEIEISATADTAAGYHFVNWSDNIDDNPRKLTVTENLELTANFAINTYALTYKVDGEIFGDVETVEYGAPLTLRDSLVKEGYTFSGWSAIPETMPKNNVTVTGSWSINQYTITFKSDTNVVYTTIKQDYNTTFDMPKEEPVKTGYTFKGWSDTLTTIPAKDTTITAKWEINKYKVTFDTDGGTEIAAIEQDYNTAFDMLKNEPTKAGYSFKGWSDTLTTIPAMDITITAKWEIEKYKIEFDYNGGALAEGVTNQAEYTIESKDITLAEPSRIGYEFEGWEGTGLTGPTKNVIITKGSTGNRSYTAKWKIENYDISYILDNNASWASGCNPTVSYNYETETVTLPTSQNIACASHTFVGWVDAAGNAITGWNAHTRVGSLELTAQWTVNQYSVTYAANESAYGYVTAKDANNNEIATGSSVDYGTTITLEAHAYEHYQFKKWSDDSFDNPHAAMPVTEAVNLTATFEPKEYNVRFEGNIANAIGGMQAQRFTYDVSQELVPNSYTANGYAFAGWATTETGAKVYDDKQTISIDDNIKLYAVWFNAQLASSATTFYKGSTLSVSAAFKTNNGSAYMPDTEQLSWQLALKTLAGTAVEGTTTTADASSASLTIPVTTTLTEGQYILHAVLNYNGTQIGEADFMVTAVEGMVAVKGATVSGPVGTGDAASKVFIDGRTVAIRDLVVCDHEVTQAEYQSVMGTNPSYFDNTPGTFDGVDGIKLVTAGETQENRPVEMVSWYDALVYCNALSNKEGLTPCYSINGSTNPADWGDVPTSDNNATWDAVTCNFDANGYRLPTEAEWEYVARGGNGGIPANQTTYSGSDNIDAVAWYNANSDSKSHEVKKKNPNTLGIYDMTGNIWEWCWDKTNKLDGADDNVTPIVSSTSFDGVGEGDKRVGRGGCWIFDANLCGVAYRRCNSPVWKYKDVGFRVVRTANAEPATSYIFIGGDNANNGNTGLTFNSPLKTIEAAAAKMNDANTNYTICVNGTLTGSQTLGEEFNGKAKSITLRGLNGTDKLDGQSQDRVLYDSTTVPVTIKNLTITRGNAEESDGGGIYIAKGATLALANGALVTGNKSSRKGTNPETGRGGGVYNAGTLFMYGSAVIGDNTQTSAASSISNCSNTAARGSGLFNASTGKAYLGYSSENQISELTGGIFYNYNSGVNNIEGTGVFNRGTVKMSSGAIAYNGSESFGVGVYNEGNQGYFELSGGKISNNKSYSSSSFGGGMRVVTSATFKMTGGEISGNQAAYCGAVSVMTATFTMTGGIISGNTSLATSKSVEFESGNFNIGGSAVIADTVRLVYKSNKMDTICIYKKIDDDVTVILAPDLYTNNLTILALDNNAQTNLLNEVGKFRLTNSDWRISTDGKLLSKDFVQVPGAYFTGAATVASSGVFVQDTQITIPNLLVCNHEVTQREWQTVMGISQEVMDEMDKKDDEADNGVHGIGDNNPAYRVTWYAAIAYCNKRSLDEGLTPVYTVSGIDNWRDLTYYQIPKDADDDIWDAVTCDPNANGYRLPTEAEWEYLARGGNLTNNGQTNYSGSNTIGEVAWYKGNSSGKTHEVKTTTMANRLGLFDMSGNVWEWCWDLDLQSPTHERHTRGGSWDCNNQADPHEWCNVNTRATDEPYELKHDLGLRVVRTVSQLGMVYVEGATVSDQVNGSLVFNGRTIAIPNLIVSDHEVTQFEYQAVMGTNPSQFISNPAEGEVQENRPVENVSWYDAIYYCNKRSAREGLTACYKVDNDTSTANWGYIPHKGDVITGTITCDFNANGYRLPTEAEWEYLARGGNLTNEGQTAYSGNDDASKVAWFGDANGQTHEVKKLDSNVLDLYDMSGNLWEWCWDWYVYPIGNTTPATGPEEGSKRCLRGGCWKTDVSNSEVVCRGYFEPKTRSSIYGFRVVRSASSSIYVGGGTSSNPTGLTPNDAFATLAEATNLIKTINNPSLDYTIYINGTLEGAQTLTADLNDKASSITLCGLNGLDGYGVPRDKLSKNYSSAVLTISTTVSVTIRDLQITGGSISGNGGGIYINNGNVTLVRGALVGDVATAAASYGTNSNMAKSGAGVYLDGGTLTMKNGSAISHNYATANNMNTSNEGGGGVFVTGGGQLNIEPGAKIEFNGSAMRAGGVLLAGKANVTMTGGAISNNSATNYGGGVLFASDAYEKTFVMNGGSISNNTVTENDINNSSPGGGGVFLDHGTFIMSGDASINGNTATLNGGGIRMVQDAVFKMQGGTISGNSLSLTTQNYGLGISMAINAQLYMGGSAYINPNNDVLVDEDNRIEEVNRITVTSQLTAEAPVATITPVSYSRTTPMLQIPDNADNSLKAEFGKFAVTPQNESTLWAISDEGYLTQTIEDGSSLQSTINSVNASGISATITLADDIYLTRGFSGKDADHKITIDGVGNYHIAIQSETNDIVIKNVNFQNGYSSQCGGMLKLVGKDLSDDDEMEPAENLPSLTIENCSFTDCGTSGAWTVDGGSIYVKGYRNMALKNTTFQGSGNYQIAMSGGFIAAFLHKTQGLDVTIEGCSFNGGTAGYGGAINLHAPTDASITIDNCVFENNEVNPGGSAGAIDCYTSATLNISNTTFTNNVGYQMVNGTRADNVLLGENTQAILTNCTINGVVVNETKTGAF